MYRIRLSVVETCCTRNRAYTYTHGQQRHCLGFVDRSFDLEQEVEGKIIVLQTMMLRD